MALRWHSDGILMAHRWHSDGTQGALRGHRTQLMGLRGHSEGTAPN